MLRYSAHAKSAASCNKGRKYSLRIIFIYYIYLYTYSTYLRTLQLMFLRRLRLELKPMQH